LECDEGAVREIKNTWYPYIPSVMRIPYCNIPDSYIAADEIETGFGNKIAMAVRDAVLG